MNPSDGGRNQGRRRPRSGFADFGADPFFGGGMMMGGSSFFDDFFSRDPFDDPFFTRPMDMGMGMGMNMGMGMGMGLGMGMGNGLLGGGGIFGRGSPFGMGMGMNNLLDRSEFITRPDGSFLDHRPSRPPPPQPEGRRGPIIEELTDDGEEAHDSKAQNGEDPIVEHPEDDEGAVLLIGPISQGRDAQRQTPSFQALSNQYQQQPNNAHQSSNSYQSYSFQSSSMSVGGSGGSFYTSSSMRRVGPDGVMQEEHVEKDSVGRESRTSARGLRDQVHALTKKRNTGSGPETTVETLRNLIPEEAPQFNAQWEAQAQRSLPGWNRGHAQALEGNYQRSNRQAQPALRYYDEGCGSGDQPSKKKKM